MSKYCKKCGTEVIDTYCSNCGSMSYVQNSDVNGDKVSESNDLTIDGYTAEEIMSMYRRSYVVPCVISTIIYMAIYLTVFFLSFSIDSWLTDLGDALNPGPSGSSNLGFTFLSSSFVGFIFSIFPFIISLVCSVKARINILKIFNFIFLIFHLIVFLLLLF